MMAVPNMTFWKGLTVAGALALLAGCATAPAPGSTDAPHAYRCERGKSFTASYGLNGRRAVVSAGGITRTLRLARSASGARYTARGMELWGKGAAATLTGFPGGPYDGCVTR
jgi:membrane-bound inhibitor of C-type lysozyme